MPIVKQKKIFKSDKRRTPLQAVRRYCVEHCMNNQAKEVKFCPTDDSIPIIGACPFHKLRFGKNPEHLPVLKQIRKRCLDCSGYIIKDVRECVIKECFLYPFRMGHNPALKGKGGNISKYRKVQPADVKTV